MRKPRDYDAELKALDDKAKDLRTRRLRQFGDLVIATGADALDVYILTGVLLAAVESKDSAQREVWRQRGAAFFQRGSRDAPSGVGRSSGGNPPPPSGTLPFGSEAGKA